MAQPRDMQGPPDPGWHETGPVFADPTGQRRRLMRVVGSVASVLLVGALIIAGIGLFGGPNTPFSVFGAPSADQNGQHGGGHHGAGTHSSSRPGSSGPSAKPSPLPDHSPSRRPSSSPAPTNRAGKTPPGQGRSKRPHPSPSRHGN